MPAPDAQEDRWVALANWNLGHWSDERYADYLEATSTEPDVAEEIVINRLRKGAPMRVIDEMPTLSEVEAADNYQLVAWHLCLRPTMMNEELTIVKAIAQRYDRMSPAERERHAARVRREHA